VPDREWNPGPVPYGGQARQQLTPATLYLLKKPHLLLTGVGHEVEQGHVLVAAGLRVGNAREAVQLEAERVAALAPVHVVAEGEDDLQHLAQSLTALNLLAGLQDGPHLGPDLRQPDGELLLVVEGAQPLLVVGDPAHVAMIWSSTSYLAANAYGAAALGSIL